MSYNNLYNILRKPKDNNNTITYNTNTYNTNNYYNENNSKKQIINVNTPDDYHINIDLENIDVEYEYIILNSKNIHLFNITNDSYIGLKLKIINLTGSLLNIYSQNNQLIYNNFYVPRDGSYNVMISPNNLFLFYIVKKNNLFSWIMI